MEYNYCVEFNEKKQKLKITKIFWAAELTDCPVKFKDGWEGTSFTTTKNQAEAYFKFLQSAIDYNACEYKKDTTSLDLESIDSDLQDFVIKYMKP